MKNPISATLILVGLLAVTPARAADPNAVVVLNRGMDAGKRYFTIQCPGDTRASVVQDAEKGELCIYPTVGERVCIQSKDIDAAARRACGVGR